MKIQVGYHEERQEGSAEEHCAADPAEVPRLPEADHRASWRAGRGHAVVRVPSPPPIPD